MQRRKRILFGILCLLLLATRARRSLARFGPRMALCVYQRPDDRTVIPQVVREARPGYQVDLATKQAYFY